MSWQDAKVEALKWLEELKLPEDLRETTIDLKSLGRSLKCQGEFRKMVLRAAGRELRHRGAKVK